MMGRGDFPSAKQDQFVVRLPEGMRDRIKAAADYNKRSMNAEIVATLEEAYPAPYDHEDALEEIASRLEKIENEIGSCLISIEEAETTDQTSSLAERYRGLMLLQNQVWNEFRAQMALIKKKRSERRS